MNHVGTVAALLLVGTREIRSRCNTVRLTGDDGTWPEAVTSPVTAGFSRPPDQGPRSTARRPMTWCPPWPLLPASRRHDNPHDGWSFASSRSIDTRSSSGRAEARRSLKRAGEAKERALRWTSRIQGAERNIGEGDAQRRSPMAWNTGGNFDRQLRSWGPGSGSVGGVCSFSSAMAYGCADQRA